MSLPCYILNMVQFVNDCICRCSDRRKLLHLDVPPTVKYSILMHCPNLYLNCLYLHHRRADPPDKLDNTNAHSQTRVSSVGDTRSPGETPPHTTAWVHFSHLEHSMPKWLFLTTFPHTMHRYLPPTGPELSFTSPTHNNTKLTHRPLQKSRLTDLLLLSHTTVPPTNS